MENFALAHPYITAFLFIFFVSMIYSTIVRLHEALSRPDLSAKMDEVLFRLRRLDTTEQQSNPALSIFEKKDVN